MFNTFNNNSLYLMDDHFLDFNYFKSRFFNSNYPFENFPIGFDLISLNLYLFFMNDDFFLF